MGNICVKICPCLCKYNYNNYDYICQNPTCSKPLDPEQELCIVQNSDPDGEDLIYCGKQCSNDCR